MVVNDTLARDSINPMFRYEGLTVYVKNIFTNFQLRQGITNSHWVVLNGNNTAYSWGNHALAGYITASSTDYLTNKSGNISMWYNDAGYLTSFNESDPIWTLASADYYTKTNLSTSGAASLHFDNLTNKPTTLSAYGITDAMSTQHVSNSITSVNLSNWNSAYNWGNHATAGYFKNTNDLFWDNTNKRLGIGTSVPSASLSVGSSNQFQVNSSGNITKINNQTVNFPSTQGAPNTILTNDGSGNLSWSTALPGGSRTKTTAEGGFAVYMYNGSGKPISKYLVVMADPNHDTSIAIAPAGCILPVGISNDSIPSGSWGWIIVSGITYVQISASVTRSWYAYVSSSADGMVEASNKKGINYSYRIVGNFLESKSVQYSKQGPYDPKCPTPPSSPTYAKIIVHFN
jgi:hypothetical protein